MLHYQEAGIEYAGFFYPCYFLPIRPDSVLAVIGYCYKSKTRRWLGSKRALIPYDVIYVISTQK